MNRCGLPPAIRSHAGGHGGLFISARCSIEAEAKLERFVLADAATGRHDEQLVWLFHRRNLRNHMQMGPPGSKMVAHYPVQRFDGREPVNTATFSVPG